METKDHSIKAYIQEKIDGLSPLEREVIQLGVQNQQLLEALAKPHELNTSPSIVINDPSGYFRKMKDALQEIAEHNPHLDDEGFEETHGQVAMLMRRLAREALQKQVTPLDP